MKKLLLASFVFISLNVSAQNTTYAEMVNTETLKKHLVIIAGEEMQGRETGTEGQRKAAAYIEQQFQKIGLTRPPSLKNYQQEYSLFKDTITDSKLEINDVKGVLGQDYVLNITANESVKIKSNSMVFAGYGIEDKNYSDYTSLDVKGKIVVMFLGEPKKDGKFFLSGNEKSSKWTYPGIAEKVALASAKGAVAVLFINPLQENFSLKMKEGARKTNIYYPRESEKNKIFYASISHSFAGKILGEETPKLIAAAKSASLLNSSTFQKKVKAKLNHTKKSIKVIATNVIGVVEGSDKKDEFIFITAHYDHLGMRDGKIYYGADDDGSGTVAVINMAEAFAKAKANGHGPRRSVVFMAVSGEEKGLWGSEYYSENPVYPLEKTSVNLNIDMIGRIDTERKLADTNNYVYVVGHNKISTELPVINESVNNKYTGLTLDYKFDDPNDKERIYFRSDHYNFARKGVPVLFFYDGMLQADYHKPTDTVDKITWDLFEKRSRMIFHTAWEMANRNDMLIRDLPVPTDTR